jgi:tetratricopeptide (TPR) repeat protein
VLRGDYIMDQISRLTVMLHKILFHKEHKQFDEAERLMSEASRHLLGLNLRSLKSLSTRDMMQLLTYNGLTDTGKAVILADLLRERGSLHQAANEMEEAYELWCKSLDILLEVYDMNQAEKSIRAEELISRVEQSMKLLERRELPLDASIKLFHYYEDRGAYAKAEDMLYFMLEDNPDPMATAELGLSFYDRLRLRSQDE